MQCTRNESSPLLYEILCPLAHRRRGPSVYAYAVVTSCSSYQT